MIGSTMNAVIYDYAAARMRAHEIGKFNLQDVLQRVENCCRWLSESGMTVIGFKKPLAAAPYVIVSVRPEVYILFSGRYERLGHKRDGALRYEVWEGMDEVNQIAVRWIEVVACA